MSPVLVLLRIFHAGKFDANNKYVGEEHENFLDIREYDIFRDRDIFISELLLAPYGYDDVVKYAIKDRVTGEFLFVNENDEDDFACKVIKTIDYRRVIEIYCECTKESDKQDTVMNNESNEQDIHAEKGKEIDDELDCDVDDEVLPDLDNILPEEQPLIDDGLEDNDFSEGEEEYIEARKKLREDKGKSVCIDTDLGGTSKIGANNEVIVCDEDLNEDDGSSSSFVSLVDIRQTKPKRKCYSKCIHPKDLKLEVGLMFKDHAECQDVVRDWAIYNGYNIKWTKSARGKLQAVCDEGCKWKFYASLIHGEPTCVVKTLFSKHSCVRGTRNRQANAIWLSNYFFPKIKSNLNMTAKEMEDEMYSTFGITVTSMICYRAKWQALEMIRGTFSEHYARLRSYVSELMRHDREGHFALKTHLDENDKPVFDRLYIGFSALRKGFLVGCRKYIGFDACFLKTVLGGVLLAAVSKDCNNNMYPIAWAVVEKETEESWTWFFQRLFDDLNISDGLGWTFMSDKQKGLINGIHSLAPHAEHRHCARHIYANWKKHFSGPKFKALFWSCVKATCKTQYEWYLSQIRAESPKAAEDFLSKGPNAFCKYLINSFTRTDSVDNNISETFNAYILKHRDKPVIDMLEEIRKSLMSRIYNLSTGIQPNSDPLCPNIRKKLDKIHNSVRFCDVRPAVGGKFEVYYEDDSYIVDLVERSCTCRALELTGIPCCYVLSCIYHNRADPIDFVDKFFLKKNFNECYKFGLSPLRGSKSWPLVEEPPILPPEYTKPPGRPRKRRKRGDDDLQNTSKTKFSQRGLRMSCRNCGGFDHNKRTCKESPTLTVNQVTRGRPPRGRQQPRARTTRVRTLVTPTTSSQDQGDPRSVRREIRIARQGVGILTGDSGNVYATFSMPRRGRSRISQGPTPTPHGEGTSQGSQVVDSSTPT